MSNVEKKQQYLEWYKKNNTLYLACAETIERLIKVLLTESNTPYHSIESRIKTEESFLNKCLNEKYQDPVSEITDVCGLRIITYTSHDVDTIRQIIEREFQIDEANSIDKSKQMSEDQVGYLSIHYIAALKEERTKLAEYHAYSAIKFEIQIRTLLQHAWAEIEHDRNYKFSGELPSEIKRRFYLVAGTLELLDREFEEISKDIDQYAKTVRQKTQTGNLDLPIDSTSLNEYLAIKFTDDHALNRTFCNKDKDIIEELQHFGINTLSDLDKIITDESILSFGNFGGIHNYLGLLRWVMMCNDPERYFENAWKKDWDFMTLHDHKLLESINPNIRKVSNLITIADRDA